jgi:hypothetical protein
VEEFEEGTPDAVMAQTEKKKKYSSLFLDFCWFQNRVDEACNFFLNFEILTSISFSPSYDNEHPR